MSFRTPITRTLFASAMLGLYAFVEDDPARNRLLDGRTIAAGNNLTCDTTVYRHSQSPAAAHTPIGHTVARFTRVSEDRWSKCPHHYLSYEYKKETHSSSGYSFQPFRCTATPLVSTTIAGDPYHPPRDHPSVCLASCDALTAAMSSSSLGVCMMR